MRYPRIWLEEDKQHAFADRHVSRFAPFAFLGSVLSLTGGVLPQHLLIKALMEENSSRWSAAWIHHESVGFATAAADVESWSSYLEAESGVVEPTEATSWARPLSSITQISVVDPHVQLQRRSGEREWGWSAGSEVCFAHGDPLLLPLHGVVDTNEEEEDAFAFIRHLSVTRWSAPSAEAT